MRVALLVALSLSCLCHAEEPEAISTPPAEREPDPFLARRHLELTLGFMGGERDFRQSGFTYAGGAGGDYEGGQALVAPLRAFPFVGSRVYGPSWEARAVLEHVRLTIGVQKPFAAFNVPDGTATFQVGGIDRQVAARSISIWELRFGLGYERTFGLFAPFVDLVGHVDWLGADLTLDAAPVTYRAQSFSFAARAGVRIQLGDYLFVAPSGELGITGDNRWGAQVLVGVLIPTG